MSDRPFRAQIPKKPDIGDEVIVKGRLKPDARVFSVNFILPQPPPVQKSFSAPASSEINGEATHKCCGQPTTPNRTWPFIAYHFKVIFDDDGSCIVVQNWKNVVWQDEKRNYSELFPDRSQPFTLIFRFHRDTIRVFIDHTHQAPDFEFEYQLPLERIRTLEIWDDVEYVEEVTFRFRNGTIHENRQYLSHSHAENICILVSMVEPCLGDCGFILSLPKPPECGDEISIKAYLQDDAERFSINLCLEGHEPDAEPMLIAYHLGLHFSAGDELCQVIQASRNTEWHVEDTQTDGIFNSRKVNVVLRLDNESIKVFHEDTQHYPDFEFPLRFSVEDIRFIQLRDGIQRVEEILLKYN